MAPLPPGWRARERSIELPWWRVLAATVFAWAGARLVAVGARIIGLAVRVEWRR